MDSVLGNKSEITSDDLSRLEYTGAVFKESLRKWPPVPSFSRFSDQDYEILGHVVPKNTWFFVSLFFNLVSLKIHGAGLQKKILLKYGLGLRPNLLKYGP